MEIKRSRSLPSVEGSAEWFTEVCRLQTSDSAGRNDVVHSVRHLLEIPEIDYRKNVMGDALDEWIRNAESPNTDCLFLTKTCGTEQLH